MAKRTRKKGQYKDHSSKLKMPKGARQIMPQAPGFWATPDGRIFSAREEWPDGKAKELEQYDSPDGPMVNHGLKCVSSRVAILVAQAFDLRPKSTDEMLIHRDLDRFNCSVENLAWGIPVIDPADIEHYRKEAVEVINCSTQPKFEPTYDPPGVVPLPKSARKIPGFSNYWADERGNIYSQRPRSHGINKKQINEGKALRLSPQISRTQYLTVKVRNDAGRGITKQVHTLVLLTFKGLPPSSEHECRHLDGNPGNNAIINLEWGTKKEQFEDQRRHGTLRIGQHKHNSKFSPEDVVIIRGLLKDGYYINAIASYFNVSRGAVDKIRSGLGYRNVA